MNLTRLRSLIKLIKTAFVATICIAAAASQPALAKDESKIDLKAADNAFLRAKELNSFGEYDEALKKLNVAIAGRPEAPDRYSERGKCLLNMKRYDEAIRDFTTRIEIEPNASGYLFRGRCYQKLGKHNEAIADFSKGIAAEGQGPKKQSKFFSLYMARGRSYDLSGDYANAMKDYNKCLEYKGGTTDGGTVRMWRDRLKPKLKQTDSK